MSDSIVCILPPNGTTLSRNISLYRNQSLHGQQLSHAFTYFSQQPFFEFMCPLFCYHSPRDPSLPAQAVQVPKHFTFHLANAYEDPQGAVQIGPYRLLVWGHIISVSFCEEAVQGVSECLSLLSYQIRSLTTRFLVFLLHRNSIASGDCTTGRHSYNSNLPSFLRPVMPGLNGHLFLPTNHLNHVIYTPFSLIGIYDVSFLAFLLITWP